LKFSLYILSAASAIFTEQDSTPVLAGDAFKQQSTNPWGPSALNGNIVLDTAGTGPSSGIADLASFYSFCDQRRQRQCHGGVDRRK